MNGSRAVTRVLGMALLRSAEVKHGECWLLPWSEGPSELGERLREPAMGFGVGGTFVVAAADVLDEGVPGSDDLGAAEAFEPAHRPQPGFQPAVISFDLVVRIPDVDMGRGGQLLQFGGR
ncbi:hypothetical protein BCD49_38980 [Pseudofrankia sp. EUN1h]|nr:hypothetical protein BCD49_38980 [Pseudofrankia sp. EUN1h]